MATTTNQGHQVKDRVKDTAGAAYDKASEYASQAAEKAGDLASKAGEKAGDLAHKAGEKADTATSSVGSGMKSLAGTVRENAPQSGMLGAASDKVAETLEAGGRYLEDKGLSGMTDDVAGLIKRNPIPAVLIGIGIGYLIARSTRS